MLGLFSIADNTALDKWGRQCWVDMDIAGGADYPSRRGAGGSYLYYSTNVNTMGGLSNPSGHTTNDGAHLTEIDRQRSEGIGVSPNSRGFGGPGAIVSIGLDGFILAGIKSGSDTTRMYPGNIDVADTQRGLEKCKACDTAGLLKFPKEGAAHFRQHRDEPAYAWNWFGEKAAEFPEAYPGDDRRVSFANAANFGLGGENASEILVGWAERGQRQINSHQHNNVGGGQTDHFVVSRADRNGKLIGQPWSLQGGNGSLSCEPTGWGEDNNWVTIPSTGCVVMTHAWRVYSGPRPTSGACTTLADGKPDPDCEVHPPSVTEDGPGSLPYQPDKAGTPSKYTNRLTLTTICPACGYVAPNPVNAPPTLRSRRGYPCSTDPTVRADAVQDGAPPQSAVSQDHPQCITFANPSECYNFTQFQYEDDDLGSDVNATDANFTQFQYEDDDSGSDANATDAGLIAALVLLFTFTVVVGVILWLRNQNQREAKAGHPPKFQRIAKFTAIFAPSADKPKHGWGMGTHHKTNPKPAANMKAPHKKHVFGPIGSHDGRDLAQHENFKHHTAEVGKGRHPAKPMAAGATTRAFGVQLLHTSKGTSKIVGHSHV